LLYQIGYLQYSTERYNEAKNNLNILETKLKPEDAITLTKKDGTNQQVKFIAAVKNLSGLIAIGEGNKEEAKKLFNEALAISPDFEAAKTSLEAANK